MERMQRVYITIGLPGSGKTTWAKDFIDNYTDNVIIRINNDDIRKELFGENFKWSHKLEDQVRKTRKERIQAALCSGYDIIIDNTHLNPTTLESLKTYINQNWQVDIIIKDFRHVDIGTCILRDMGRGKDSVGESVIMRMAKEGGLIKDPTPYPVDLNLPWTIICDLDGTLANIGNRNPYDASMCDVLDTPNNHVLYLLQTYHDISEIQHCFSEGIGNPLISKIHFFSGRMDKHKTPTLRFLSDKCGFHVGDYFKLEMRKTGDLRSDEIIKEEIFDEHIRGKYNVFVVIDDRPKVCRMWRSLGLPVFNVGDGREF